MTFHGNLTKVECCICGRRISKSNFSKHAATCTTLTKNELCAAAWQRAADVLQADADNRVPARFREPVQEAVINKHIKKVIVPFLERHAARYRDEEASRSPVSPPGSRNGWWMDNCPKHGRTSFNTIVEGCEQCARERLEEK